MHTWAGNGMGHHIDRCRKTSLMEYYYDVTDGGNPLFAIGYGPSTSRFKPFNLRPQFSQDPH
jgi:hypothetical protein